MATKKKTTAKASGGGKRPPKGKAATVQKVLDDQLFAMHFQPIVDLKSHKVFANEALCRPNRDFFPSPVELIAAAVETNHIGELGRMQRDFAVKNSGESSLFLNLDPHEFDEPWLVRPDDPIFKHRHPIYLEITENVPLKYFDQCHSVLAELRKKGNFLVIDDFGAGFSNLKYIAELRPDIVKLDRELVRECRVGTSEANLLTLITGLCHRMNARVVAEGIETPEELAAVLAAGVDFGQGYLFAKPSPEPPDISWPVLPIDTETLSQKPNGEDDAAQEGEEETEGKKARGSWKAALGSDRHAHLQAEVKKLTDLLVQSEVARLSLVKRLKEQPDDGAPPSKPLDLDDLRAVPEVSTRSSETARHADSGSGRVEEEDSWAKDSAALLSGAAFSARKSVRKLGMPFWALAALLAVVVLVAAWIAWPDGERQVDLQETPAQATAAASPQTPVEVVAAPAAVQDEPAPVPADDEGGSPAGVQPAAVSDEQAAEDPAAAELTPERLIAARLESWAQAWAGQHSDEYLSFYSVSFQTPSGEPFREWAAVRRQRLARPAWIEVGVRNPNVRITGPNRALATFEQTYAAPGYSDRVMKTQVWVFEYSRWHILAESSAPLS